MNWRNLALSLFGATTLSALMCTAVTSAGAAPALGAMPVLRVESPEGVLSPVIVQLKEDARLARMADGTDAGDDAYARESRLRQGSVILSALGRSADALSGRALVQFDFLPMFSLLATDSEIARLKADNRVAGVSNVRVFRPTLDDAVGIVKMTGVGGAYTKRATGKGQAIAVLDTGVFSAHEFMTGKVVSEACYNKASLFPSGATSRCPGGVEKVTGAGTGVDCLSTVAIGCSHGTHVAGIAGGKNPMAGAGEPSHGIAKNGKIIAINIFTQFNPAACGTAIDSCVGAFDPDMLLGLQRVYKLRNKLNQKIAAVNMSLGDQQLYTGFCNGDPLKPAIDKLKMAGIATVIAAGNEQRTNGTAAPGCIGSAITVGASSKFLSGQPERVADYSNIGRQVDVLAPGGDATYPAGHPTPAMLSSYDTAYDQLQGTSMAAPVVAGAIAAIKSRKACRGKSVAKIEKALRNVGPAITDHRTGVNPFTVRRINVVRVMKKLNCA